MPSPGATTPGRCRAVAGAALLVLAAGTSAQAEPPPARQAELRHLLRHDCGACHGMTLGGGLGPPLTPAALAGRSAAVLEAAILAGRPGTPMPPWAGILTPAEVGWLVEQMRRGVPGVRDE